MRNSAILIKRLVIIRYVIDSWAWVEYLDGTEKGEKVKKIIEDDNEIFTVFINLAEVMSIVKRKNRDYKTVSDTILSLSKIFYGDIQFLITTGLLHAEMRKTMKDFGLADAFALATAKKLGAKLLTGDPHFKNMKEAIMI